MRISRSEVVGGQGWCNVWKGLIMLCQAFLDDRLDTVNAILETLIRSVAFEFLKLS